MTKYFIGAYTITAPVNNYESAALAKQITKVLNNQNIALLGLIID